MRLPATPISARALVAALAAAVASVAALSLVVGGPPISPPNTSTGEVSGAHHASADGSRVVASGAHYATSDVLALEQSGPSALGAAEPPTPSKTTGRGAMLTGTGLVFESDPSAGEPQLFALPRLLGDGLTLSGEYVIVSSLVFDTDGAPTQSTDGAGAFMFEPITDEARECYSDPTDCSEFDNVNAYFHIDRYASEFWVDRLGIDINFVARVYTHGGTSSWAHEHLISLSGGGLFLYNHALEDDILYHEYVHLVLAQLGFAQDMTFPQLRRAIGEGYADYFALTYVGHPEFANWATKCPPRYECGGPADDNEIRTLATDPSVWNWNHGNPSEALQYGVCTRRSLLDLKCKTSWSTFENTYRWAMIWGSTLWDIRTALGADVTDRLVLSSIVRKNGDIHTFEEAADAILLADWHDNGGAHNTVISDIFDARGISHTVVDIEGDGAFVAGNDFDVEVYPNPSAGEFTVNFDLPMMGQTTIRLYDVSGREVFVDDRGSLTGGRHELALAPRHLAGGLYVLRVETAEASASAMVYRR